MALKTNFTDDILSESMNGKRQYNVTENSNGTKSLEDVTDYQSVGSTFSAKDMNETNAAVNQAYDDMGDEFNPEVDYAVGDYTIRNNKVWKFTTAHPAGAWDESHVKATKILSEARELTEKFEDAAKKIVVLWTNPEWNSSTNLTPFVAQEIQIDNISDFDMIGICHSVYNNTSNYFNFFLNIFNKELNLTETFSVVNTTDYYVRLYYRKFIITQSGIKFDIGYSNSHTQVTASNNYAIPVKIIGIKF
jgi:hypothetical protein|nr:MAG TPA: hypothetical protein [Bacteriophage sp.]